MTLPSFSCPVCICIVNLSNTISVVGEGKASRFVHEGKSRRTIGEQLGWPTMKKVYQARPYITSDTLKCRVFLAQLPFPDSITSPAYCVSSPDPTLSQICL